MSASLTRTLLILTFVTGILDAISFLALGQVFVAMQTGNVIFLGIGVAGGAGASVGMPLTSLAAFLLGSLTAALFVRPAASEQVNGLRSALAIEVAILACAGLLAALAEVDPRGGVAYLLVALLALAMGLRNTIARRVGDPNMTTTVLNLTLIAFASHGPFGLASPGDLERRGTAILVILGGAFCGALLLKAGLALTIAIAAVLTAAAFASIRSVAPSA